MIKKHFFLVLLCCFANYTVFAQDVSITVNATYGKRAISPYIYGRNNTFDKPASFYKDVGLRFARMNGGNNATKYNWRKKITSHPDWYNNVYQCDWDKTSQQVASDHPDMQVMWAFQLLGRVASSTNYNFNDWEFNQSKWWDGAGQNLAGGGVPNTNNPSGKALTAGDINLYTQAWPIDSSVAILDHWFGPGGLGFNKNQFLYWSMDNEPDIWDGTHDDVMSSGLLPASEFMDRFIELAKKARSKFPEIKICGPVTTSEWQWYKWGKESIAVDGQYYCWLEYFIKRCADEEKTSGVRVLDVVDIHNYPYFSSNESALQLHRMYYDETYEYPGANAVKTIEGTWDTTQTKEFIFKRINGWLDKHFGEGHGITCGLSEWSPGPSESNLASVIYASHLGLFADNGVEFFSPWTWFTGMWETLHLFSRYGKAYRISSASSLENTVSAYTSVNKAVDSMTIIIVNRDLNSVHNVNVHIEGFAAVNGNHNTLQLSSLPANESFISHSQNALKQNAVTVTPDSFSISVPALSTTAILLKGVAIASVHRPSRPTLTIIKADVVKSSLRIEATDPLSRNLTVKFFRLNGDVVKTKELRIVAGQSFSGNVELSDLSNGFYMLEITSSKDVIYSSKIFITK
jgi:hypothetical protein